MATNLFPNILHTNTHQHKDEDEFLPLPSGNFLVLVKENVNALQNVAATLPS